MNFIKMQGAGNDYIFVDGLIDPDKIRRLSDRHYGIGGDGVVCLCTSFIADVRMRMFNADGSVTIDIGSLGFGFFAAGNYRWTAWAE